MRRMIREVTVEGKRLKVDDSGQVVSLDCPEDVTWDDPGLAPRVADLGGSSFVSCSVLAAKGKAFDDGLIAAVELAAQAGAGGFAGKAALLARLAAALGTGPAAPIAAAARDLGSGVKPPAPIADAAARLVADFLADERTSKPLGFYTWSPALESVFRQDRFLQREFPDPTAFLHAARTLHADPALRTGYHAWMSLGERLTNPFTRPDLRRALAALDAGREPAFERGTAFAPPSESPEGALVKRLFADRPVPEGFNLADRLIAEIRKGGVDLSPAAASGWYDRVAWSLETLADPSRGPEAAKLELSASYREALEALFKGILALARESHVKQLEEPMAGCGPPRPKFRPVLTVEPLPTHYLRRAKGYAFVRGVLETAFGGAALRGLRRLTASGPVDVPLDDELAGIERLFLGAHAAACAEIGLAPEGGSAADFAGWAADRDPDLGQDNRMMVPVFFDVERRRTKVWAFLGWRSRPLVASFAKPPKVEVLGSAEKRGWFGFGAKPAAPEPVEFESARYSLAYPVTAEVYVSTRLNREEFRAHCDRYRTPDQILSHLA